MDGRCHSERAGNAYISNRCILTLADNSRIAAAVADDASLLRTKVTTFIAPTPSLLGLPLELRLQILKHLFHSDTSKCRDNGFLGCRCGENLCSTNRQLFNEMRSRYLNHRRFVFKTPTSCLNFLKHIGIDYIHLKDIAISFRNLYSDAKVLKEIFNPFRASNTLRDLQLEFQDDDSASPRRNPFDSFRPSNTLRDLQLDFQVDDFNASPLRAPPVYYLIPLPEPAAEAGTEARTAAILAATAAAYGLSFRPLNHPLGNIQSLRALTVLGHPGTCEIEECLFRLSRRMDEIAQNEGKILETQYMKVSRSSWFYRISIEDAT